MKTLLAVLLAATTTFPWTRSNDDSCDIGVAPAATLLVPLFEVDLTSSDKRTTLFSITNVTHQPQIARVTIWSDWSYPVFAFNVYLTGYDVQSIDLRDVLVRGVVAKTSNAAPSGAMSSTANPNFLPTASSNCAAASMPTEIPFSLLSDIRSALTTGVYPLCGTTRVGGTHSWAMGYVTIDVVADCTFATPAERAYHERELLFDNVLIGDYQIVDPGENYGQGEAMVHIRAIPESATRTNLPFTFYDRYSKGLDRRQPLPSVFAARYLQGGGSGFGTEFWIWRESVTGAGAACSQYAGNRSEALEMVRFDMRENPTIKAPQIIHSGGMQPEFLMTPSASAIPSTSTSFPPLTSGDVGGWMYMNLNRGWLSSRATRAAQAWVVLAMSAEGRYASQFAAAPLGNGCSPGAPWPTTSGRAGGNPIGPRP